MSIFTERQALKEYTEWLREERRRLGQEYWKAMERLRTLDEQQNVLSESEEIIDKLSEAISLFSNSKSKPKTVTLKQIEKENPISPQDIEREKDRAFKKRRRNNDISVVAKMVLIYLKEKGVPVSLKEIDEFLKSNEVFVANPTSTMNKVRVYEPSVEKASRGYYQSK